MNPAVPTLTRHSCSWLSTFLLLYKIRLGNHLSLVAISDRLSRDITSCLPLYNQWRVTAYMVACCCVASWLFWPLSMTSTLQEFHTANIQAAKNWKISSKKFVPRKFYPLSTTVTLKAVKKCKLYLIHGWTPIQTNQNNVCVSICQNVYNFLFSLFCTICDK